MPFAKPCLDCGTLTRTGNRCTPCKQRLDRDKEARRNTPERAAYKRAMYGGTYPTRRRALLATATHCQQCGTPPTPTNPLQADHIHPGNPNSPLQALCRACNTKKSNKQPEQTFE